MNRYDALVIGGGPNGLACATRLALSGRKTAVLERRAVFGGLAAGEAFHPGYTTPGIHHDTGQLRSFVIEALNLKQYGLEFAGDSRDLWVMDAEGRAVHLTPSGEHLEPEDRAGLEAMNAFVEKARPVLTELFNEPPRDLMAAARGDWKPLLKPGLALRRLGGDFMLELLRVPPMCAADWVSEYVADERVRAALAYDGVIRSFAGPWSPGTAADLLMHRALAGPSVRGGARWVAWALEQAARAAGVTLLAETEAEALVIQSGRVTGVQTQRGDTLEAPVVVATCDPRRTLGTLLDPAHLPYHLEHHAAFYRGEGIAAKVHLALKAPVQWKGIRETHPEHVRIMDSLDAVERSFDPVKYGAFSQQPVLDVMVPTVSDPDLAPPGHAVVSVWVHGVPYALEGGWNDTARRALLEAVTGVLVGVTEGLESSLVASEVLTPVDLEERYGLERGHVFHGDHALDQLLIRPIPECTQYATFLPGLHLGGSGSFPGGGLTGAPGVLCARHVIGS